MTTKTCSKCKTSKPLSDFVKDSSRQNGVRCYCKACAAKRQREYNLRNRERVNGYRKRSYSRNKEHYSRLNKAYAKKHRGLLMVRGAKIRAKAGKLPFDLDLYRDEIQQRVDAGFCELTGIPFNLNGGRAWDTPSLDRITPKGGYVYSNVRVVCRAINCMMGNWGEQTMVMVFGAYHKNKTEA